MSNITPESIMSDLRYLQFPYNCGCQYRNNQFGSYTEPPEGDRTLPDRYSW